jgi:hypothetical protein
VKRLLVALAAAVPVAVLVRRLARRSNTQIHRINAPRDGGRR